MADPDLELKKGQGGGCGFDLLAPMALWFLLSPRIRGRGSGHLGRSTRSTTVSIIIMLECCVKMHCCLLLHNTVKAEITLKTKEWKEWTFLDWDKNGCHTFRNEFLTLAISSPSETTTFSTNRLCVYGLISGDSSERSSMCEIKRLVMTCWTAYTKRK